jgi:thiamine pyrophosphokinase
MAGMSRFAILLGGDLVVTPRLRRQIAGARIIAADSGMKHASSLGFIPELWVGDFDSAGSELLLDYALVPRQTHSADKDATDGEIAVGEALRRGANEIVLIGGLGGESDHVTAHLGMALHLANSGLNCLISNGEEEAHPLIAGTYEFDFGPQSRLSIIPWSDITGLNLTGVKWPLKDKALTLGTSFTMSNVALGPVKLSFASGIAIAIAYPTNTD